MCGRVAANVRSAIANLQECDGDDNFRWQYPLASITPKGLSLAVVDAEAEEGEVGAEGVVGEDLGNGGCKA